MSWVKNGQTTEINNRLGDEIYAEKSAHSARRFKQNMIYNARKTNVNNWKHIYMHTHIYLHISIRLII